MRLIPSRMTDRLPIDRWRRGNLTRFGPIELHFCGDEHVRTVEINHRIIAQGRALFPYGRWDSEGKDEWTPDQHFGLSAEASAATVGQQVSPTKNFKKSTR